MKESTINWSANFIDPCYNKIGIVPKLLEKIMTNKATKEKRRNAPSGVMSDEMWDRAQENSAKGSDMTITDEKDGNEDVFEEFESVVRDCQTSLRETLGKAEPSLYEAQNKVLSAYRKLKRKLLK